MKKNTALLKTGIIDRVVAALCGFTPALVALLGAVGLYPLVGYLDFVLWPILALFVCITLYAMAAKGRHRGVKTLRTSYWSSSNQHTLPESLMLPEFLGSCSDPELILYLPNPPLLPTPEQPVDIPTLIALNGNHWRKIFTILAKLSSPQVDWRQYRDEGLLKRREAICFGNALLPINARHLVAGKASWARLGLDPSDFCSLDDQQRVWKRDSVFLTPYLDYRQFPNQLIAQLKQFLN